jgi:hypothetical protein
MDGVKARESKVLEGFAQFLKKRRLGRRAVRREYVTSVSKFLAFARIRTGMDFEQTRALYLTHLGDEENMAGAKKAIHGHPQTETPYPTSQQSVTFFHTRYPKQLRLKTASAK